MAGARDSDKGVEMSTQEKRSCHFDLWVRFLKYIELDHDPFLDSLDQWSRPRIGVAFAKAYRAGQFETKGKNAVNQQIAGGTVDTALGNVAATFRANDRPDPFVDTDGKRHRLLQQQVKAYKKWDPKPKQQKAVPARVLRRILEKAITEKDAHVSDLIGGAFFFACRSCEYSEVQGERKTRVLELGNIQFLRNQLPVHQLDPNLAAADSVSITFVLQKNNVKYDSITMWATKPDEILCPVKRWARLVQRIRSYPGSNDSTPVNTFFDEGLQQYVTIKSTEIACALRTAARSIGEDNLGFKAIELGTHSIRAGAAMAMYLTDTPVYTIMLVGRWSSDAFLRYIRTQVQRFARGVSLNMVKSEDFFTVPAAASLEDLQTSNNRNNLAGRGLVSGLSDAARPRLSLYH